MSFDPIFQYKYNNWRNLEKAIEAIDSTLQKGDAFEQFVYFYLKYFKSLYQIKEIYCPVVDRRPFPSLVVEKLQLEIKDHGVDGVYITHNGDFIAWQSKFRTKNVSPTFSELSTFWTEAEYADFRLIVSNAFYLPKIADKKTGHISILYDQFEKLDIGFFEQLANYSQSSNELIHINKKVPRDYQQEIIDDLIRGFQNDSKGKLIAACGIGKTLIALWLSEKLALKRILFFAPSLQLIRQTLEEWSIQSKEAFRYICVCSDQSVDANVDTNNIDLSDIDIPVTTDKIGIISFLNSFEDSKKTVVFCTYHSSITLHSALKKAAYDFDLVIYDEAHRTAGATFNDKFSGAVLDENIASDRKLFMTATERLVRPGLFKEIEGIGKVVFSMNDERIYGKVFHRLTFGDAIKKGIIADYRIAFVGITNKNVNDIVRRNNIVKDVNNPMVDSEIIDNVYKRLILKKAFQELDVTKIISFHSKISEAKNFADNFDFDENLNRLYFTGHVNGSMTSQRRSLIIEEFEKAELGLLTNVRCLTEGIDIPLINGVYFADPKGSLIDIVQAVGRALRQPYGQKGNISYIIIPLLIDDMDDANILSGQGFEALFNLIQAMRDQDDHLAEWIDSINIGAARGKVNRFNSLGKLQINIPLDLDYEKFSDSLLLKIASVNKDPTGSFGIGSKLGKNQRKGSFSRLYKTICDYTPIKLEESLIKPTFEIIKDLNCKYTAKELKISNNNISHCIRLGLISKNNDNLYSLTSIGKIYKNSTSSFSQIVKNQLMLFYYQYDKGKLYPYRIAFEFIKQLGQINFIQFIYGLYSIQFDEEGLPDLRRAVDTAKSIQTEFPYIEVTNEANKQEVLNILNEKHAIGFSYENVWTDRTTTGNQYRYLIRHLELFPEIFYLKENKLNIRSGKEVLIDNIISQTEDIIDLDDYGNQWWIED